MNLREAIQEATAIGIAIVRRNRTGEYAAIPPRSTGLHQLTVNARRKDAPRELVKMIRRVEELKVDPRRDASGKTFHRPEPP